MSEYLDKSKLPADTLVATGQTIDNDELIQVTLNGLPMEYESLITSITTGSSSSTLKFPELYGLLLNQERRLSLLRPKTIDQSENTRAAFFSYLGRGRGHNEIDNKEMKINMVRILS